jgi:hypothetical protein
MKQECSALRLKNIQLQTPRNFPCSLIVGKLFMRHEQDGAGSTDSAFQSVGFSLDAKLPVNCRCNRGCLKPFKHAGKGQKSLLEMAKYLSHDIRNLFLRGRFGPPRLGQSAAFKGGAPGNRTLKTPAGFLLTSLYPQIPLWCASASRPAIIEFRQSRRFFPQGVLA